MARILIIVFLFCAISKKNVIIARTFTEDSAIEYMENMEKQILVLTSRINKLQANQDQQIASQDTEFAMMNARLAQQDCSNDKNKLELEMANMEKQILVLTTKINKDQDMMANQKINIVQQNTKIAKQDTKFAIINRRFAELDCSYAKKKVEQNKKDPCNCSAEQKLKFVEQASQIAEQNKSLSDQKAVISKLKTTLANQAARMGNQTTRLAEYNATFKEQAARIGNQTTRLAEYNATFEEQAARIGNQKTIIGHLNSSLDKHTTRLAEQAAQIADQNVIIEQLNKSLAKEIAKHKKGPSLVSCATVDCKNNGTCTAGKCKCNLGYEGDFCERANCMVFGNHNFGIEENGMCVWISTVKSTWPVARQRCLDDGGSLIVPSIVGATTLRELTQVLVQRGLISNNGYYSVWLGASEIKVEGTWTWEDGSGLSKSDDEWEYGQPNNPYNKSCLDVYRFKGWDGNCENQYRYICGGNILQ